MPTITPSGKLNIKKTKILIIRIKRAQDITKQKFYSAQKYIETTTNKYRRLIDLE
jgi:hypothetical protein